VNILSKACLTLIFNALNYATEVGDELLVKMISEALLNYSIIFGDAKAKKYSEEIYRKYSEDVEVEEILAAKKEFKKDYYLLPAIYVSLKLLDKGDKNIFRIVKLLLEAANCLSGETKFNTSNIKEGELSKDVLQIYYEVEERLFGGDIHYVPFEKMWSIIVETRKSPRVEDITTIDFIYETIRKLKMRNIRGKELSEALMMIISSIYRSEEVKELAKAIIHIESAK